MQANYQEALESCQYDIQKATEYLLNSETESNMQILSVSL